jgi:release factor glutamine methyltransferase
MNTTETIAAYFKRKLTGYYPDDEIKAVSRLIMEEVYGVSLVDLFSDKNTILSDTQIQKLDDIIIRLQHKEPVQYILGRTVFYGMPFQVNRYVLIPRPETEELVEWVIKESDEETKSILDIGTGSGCIAVVLAKKLPETYVEAWDFSMDALKMARENASRNNATVHFSQQNVLQDIAATLSFDVIVSNPPYVTESEKNDMESTVLDFEPHLALFVPDDNALLFYERIADLAMQILKPHGKMYFEINREKGQEIVEMLAHKGFINIELRKDISGNDRMIRAQKE